ncbi:ribosomal protection-like ABC-F family protein [Proteiniclasticum sp.]|uniref:ribosomal protection-like ABC-F family protein n=1 Tax=Proteiniclasticum sp. TaxID=2053595 RepID=UPI00289EA1C6|nr:ABC-F type ribosomal protection protein [Proteiniclasticum sp.]
MQKLIIKDLYMKFPSKDLFEHVSLEIHDNDRIGILGRNGSGKTTLISIILGSIDPTGGTVHLGCPYGYLPQSSSVTDETLKDILKGNYDKDLFKLMEDLSIRKMMNREISRLSGGEKTKLLFLNAVKDHPPLLILDEPTNFLDTRSIEVIEEYLASYRGAVLLISHDRDFLDHTVNEIHHLDQGTLKKYSGNYTFFRKKREEEIRRQNIEYIKYTKKRKELEAAAKGISDKANKLEGLSKNDYLRSRNKQLQKKAKSMRKRIEKMEVMERPHYEKEVNLAFNISEEKASPVLVRGENIAKSFDFSLFEHVNFHIRNKSKIALLGENGAGKTTLMKIILGQISYDGRIHIPPSAKIGYLSQELYHLEKDKTPLEDLGRYSDDPSEIRNLLGSMRITKDMVFQKIGSLSYGEKLRVELCKLILKECNLLILDEPTNFLDIETKEIIEEALSGYEGAILLISHDRYFIKAVAEEIWLLEEKRLKTFEGDYEYFLDKQKPKVDSHEDILILEMNLAELAHKMTLAAKVNLPELEREYFALAGKLNELKNKSR